MRPTIMKILMQDVQGGGRGEIRVTGIKYDPNKRPRSCSTLEICRTRAASVMKDDPGVRLRAVVGGCRHTMESSLARKSTRFAILRTAQQSRRVVARQRNG